MMRRVLAAAVLAVMGGQPMTQPAALRQTTTLVLQQEPIPRNRAQRRAKRKANNRRT